MLRRGPLLVDLLMALAALRSGGIEGLVVDQTAVAIRLSRRGNGLLSRLFSLCSSLRVLLDKSFQRGVRCGRFFSLGESQPGRCLSGWKACSLAGRGNCILAEECCVYQHGARESA